MRGLRFLNLMNLVNLTHKPLLNHFDVCQHLQLTQLGVGLWLVLWDVHVGAAEVAWGIDARDEHTSFATLELLSARHSLLVIGLEIVRIFVGLMMELVLAATYGPC